MAIVKCPECGKEVSDTAQKCVHCGYRTALTKSVKSKITTALLFQLIAIILLIFTNYIYVFDGVYHRHIYSEYGRDFDYSYYEHDSATCSSNIFLKHNTTDPDVRITGPVKILSYIVIAAGCLTVVISLYILLRKECLKGYWKFPVLVIVTLLIHSCVVSLSQPGMIEANGHYEIKPGILWFVVIVLEILSAVIGNNNSSKSIRKQQEEAQSVMNNSTEVMVDPHGNLYYMGQDTDE